MGFFSNIFGGDVYDDEENESYWLKNEAVKNLSNKTSRGTSAQVFDALVIKGKKTDSQIVEESKNN